MIKVLQDISRQEWIALRWIEIPPVMGDDDDRSFRTDGRRTPDEALQAMEEWDVTAEEREFEPEEEKGPVQ
jgi:hypothetical protein